MVAAHVPRSSARGAVHSRGRPGRARRGVRFGRRLRHGGRVDAISVRSREARNGRSRPRHVPGNDPSGGFAPGGTRPSDRTAALSPSTRRVRRLSEAELPVERLDDRAGAGHDPHVLVRRHVRVARMPRQPHAERTQVGRGTCREAAVPGGEAGRERLAAKRVEVEGPCDRVRDLTPFRARVRAPACVAGRASWRGPSAGRPPA